MTAPGRLDERGDPGLPELPRVVLLHGPTPLQPLARLSGALGGRTELWIKREDLGPLAFSGNKLRNLEFLLGEALAHGADAVVTSGRRWSNHCRLTAAAGARLGLEVHVVISGPTVARSPNLELIRQFDGVVHEAGTDDRRERESLVDAVAAQLAADGRRVEVIPVGGSGRTGAWGQVLAAIEVADQASALGFEPTTILLPSASGGTQAGLIVGGALAASRAVGPHANAVARVADGGAASRDGGPRPDGAGRAHEAPRVIGVLTARPEHELRPIIETLVGELAALAGIEAPVDPVELDASQLGPGYGKPTAAAEEAARLLARTEGILVDPVYTAKALAGLIRLVRSGALDGRRAIFWHGGGLPALFEDLESSG